jgi:hypothetical protein
MTVGFGQEDTTILGMKELAVPNAKRIRPEETHEKMRAGTALLVCACHSDNKSKTMPLEGAIPLSVFQSRFSSLSKDQEIIFYCA